MSEVRSNLPWKQNWRWRWILSSVIEKVCHEFQVTFLDPRQQNNKQDSPFFDCLLLRNSLANRVTDVENKTKRCKSNDPCFASFCLPDSLSSRLLILLFSTEVKKRLLRFSFWKETQEANETSFLTEHSMQKHSGLNFDDIIFWMSYRKLRIWNSSEHPVTQRLRRLFCASLVSLKRFSTRESIFSLQRVLKSRHGRKRYLS